MPRPFLSEALQSGIYVLLYQISPALTNYSQDPLKHLAMTAQELAPTPHAIIRAPPQKTTTKKVIFAPLAHISPPNLRYMQS